MKFSQNDMFAFGCPILLGCVEKNNNGLCLVKYKIYQIQLKYIHLEVKPWYNCKCLSPKVIGPEFNHFSLSIFISKVT